MELFTRKPTSLKLNLLPQILITIFITLSLTIPTTKQTSATIIIDKGPHSLYQEADLIIVGTVKNSRPITNKFGAIFTDTEIKILKRIKPLKKFNKTTLTVRTPGGSLKNKTSRIMGSPRFSKMITVTLYLKQQGDLFTPVGLGYGVFYHLPSPFTGDLKFRDLGGVTLLADSQQPPLMNISPDYNLITTIDGKLIRWPEHAIPIPIKVNESGSDDVTDNSEFKAIEDALATWQAPDCTNILFDYQGTFSLDTHSAYVGDGNNHIIWIENSWNITWGGGIVIALTRNHWDDEGFLYESDILLNGEFFTFGTDGNPHHMDIRGVVTHELGHLIGLSHSSDREAVMSATSSSSQSVMKRFLRADDIEGICFLYPCSEGQDCASESPDPGIPNPQANGYGLCSPCTTHDECGSIDDLCLLNSESGEQICGRSCSQSPCPNQFSCANITDTETGITDQQCIPAVGSCADRISNLCVPCSDNSHCGTEGNQCISPLLFGRRPIDYGYCGSDCNGGTYCPEGYYCELIWNEDGAVSGQQCLPVTLSCEPNNLDDGRCNCTLARPGSINLSFWMFFFALLAVLGVKHSRN